MCFLGIRANVRKPKQSLRKDPMKTYVVETSTGCMPAGARFKRSGVSRRNTRVAAGTTRIPPRFRRQLPPSRFNRQAKPLLLRPCLNSQRCAHSDLLPEI
ncbi:hypothetical protein SKAU_G00149060 [Synaphobranchus kaupii]|uniref:Uncharacterized protein n=1 Tax=Synaphobranchus kaupii TaxID=118154 RepID=A0A9Q1FUU0_SYNKA|nr:hypothetical protein SKAU_G00149060 [Synaphobranchus kaupii]